MNIDILLDKLDKSITWVSSSLQGEKKKNAHRNLLNFRRLLNKKKFALSGNPAAAIYGESQVGKSYLVSSLLSESERPFNIVDGQGNRFDFINEINPIGRGAESTSIVTRFSTGYEPKNLDYPVQAKLLSPTDLVIVLCDSYYNDIKSKLDITLKSESINLKIKEIYNKYIGHQFTQNILGEEDILEIYEYLYTNFSVKSANIIHSNYFDLIGEFISKVEPKYWFEIFSILWNENEHVTKLYCELIEHYAKLDFTEIIYLPIQAVLRKHGTLLDVLRLYEIHGENIIPEEFYTINTPALISRTDHDIVINEFSKSYLCALSAELVFQLPKELEKSKPFLIDTDLLDFPGARHRLGISEENIEDIIVPQMLLRGKVSFLFNKYSRSEKINILLFCHGDRQSAQSIMPELLKNWIKEMIGKTSADREKFIEKSKIPPFFIISTMFNLDLQYDPNNDKKANRVFKDSRWNKRFDRVLKKEILGADNETFNWIEDWTISSPNFQNIFLLRDFYYSSDLNSQLYRGYHEFKKELEEIIPATYLDFRKDLCESFVEYNFVKRHFKDPQNSWDRAVRINEDGTNFIIECLTLAAKNINAARTEKSKSELFQLKEKIVNELRKYYHDSESDAQLKLAKSKAGNVQLNLDIAFGKDPYFFGQVMKRFMLNSNQVYKIYLEKIHAIERREVVNLDKYSAIRMNVPMLNPNEDFNINLQYLKNHYEKMSIEECKSYFESEGIDLNELFYGNNERVKNFSLFLSESLEDFWFNHYIVENKQYLSGIFSEIGFQDFQDMLRVLYRKLNISKIIAESIRGHVDGYRNIEHTYEMIADISTEIINKFINSIGLDFCSETDFRDLKEANEKNTLGLVLDYQDLNYNENSLEEAAGLITKMGDLPSLLNQNPLPKEAKRLPNFRSYIIWYNLLKLGFISVCDIPNYDVHANNLLKPIIDELQTIK